MNSIPMNPIPRLPLVVAAGVAAVLLFGPFLVAPAPAAPIPDPNESARVFDVCPEGCPFATIQRALNAAVRSTDNEAGAVVRVACGMYREFVAFPTVGTLAQNVTIQGEQRDCVTITGPFNSGAAVVALAGKNIGLRNLTVRSARGAGDYAVGFAFVENSAVIEGIRAVCLGVNTGQPCVKWESSVGGVENKFVLANSLIEYGTAGGLGLADGGYMTTIGNHIRSNPNESLTAGTLKAVFIDVTVGSFVLIQQTGDLIEVNRASTATATTEISGVSITPTGGFVPVFYVGNGLTIRVDDNGSSTTGTANGFLLANSQSQNSDITCNGCDVIVDRDNVGITRGYAASASVAHVLRVVGGKVRAVNTNASAVDLFQSSVSTVVATGLDFVTKGGVISSFAALAAVDAVAGCTANQFFIDNGGASRELCWCNAGTTQCVALGAGVVD